MYVEFYARFFSYANRDFMFYNIFQNFIRCKGKGKFAKPKKAKYYGYGKDND